MWIGKRAAQDHLNDYWNALDRHAPPDELARLRAQIDPELMTLRSILPSPFTGGCVPIPPSATGWKVTS